MCPIPTNEGERLEALRRYNVLDTSPEPIFDNIAQLAALACETPTALLTLVDDKRQWFKAKIGFAKEETARDIAFCAYTISGNQMFEVEDALQDERFCDNPLVARTYPLTYGEERKTGRVKLQLLEDDVLSREERLG